MAQITINGISVDPQAQGTALTGAHLASPDSSGSDYILVQTNGPLTTDQKAELKGLDAQILEYVPYNTYLCHYPPGDLSLIRALPYVTWANVYLKEFKIAPRLRSSTAAPKMGNLLALGSVESSMSNSPRTVEVVLHRNVKADDVREKLAAAAGLDPDQIQMSGQKARLVVQPDRLEDLAALDQVRHIEEFTGYKLSNNVASSILRADLTHSQANLEGEGQIVAVCDTGFDQGSTTDVHPAFSGRVIKLYALGRPTASDPEGHGTHVTGSVLGDGTSAAIGAAIRGTAPKAKLVLQSVLDVAGGLGGLPLDLKDLFIEPYQNEGARVHTNSWGDTHGDGSYKQNSYEVDEFVWNHRDCVICFAAGNDGTDADGNGVIDAGSVGAPSTAKNCITVGACESSRAAFTLTYGQGWPTDFPAAPIAPDPVANNPDGMAAFSSRGPTTDNRIKPDVVAPGTAILSTLSRAATNGKGWGPSPDPLYFYDGGTSMATPLVAGCAAVVREYFLKQSVSPSAALVKAMLINAATAIAGQYVPSETGPAPNISEGFGRVDLAAAVGPRAANEQVQFFDENTVLDTGGQEQRTVTVPATASALKVTLVWSDPPGESLQNDLDLIVKDTGGQERHGNMPVSSADFDRTNNVEQVVWSGVTPGDYQIIVQAHRIPVDPQSYALVVRTA